jgi:hypothetical protein
MFFVKSLRSGINASCKKSYPESCGKHNFICIPEARRVYKITQKTSEMAKLFQFQGQYLS